MKWQNLRLMTDKSYEWKMKERFRIWEEWLSVLIGQSQEKRVKKMPFPVFTDTSKRDLKKMVAEEKL